MSREQQKYEVMMSIARLMGSLGTCDRARVGCLIVKEGRIIATGYNGSLNGDAHCDVVGHQMEDNHCIRTVHAEQNALMIAAKFGLATKGCDVYVTHTPCRICSKLLKQAGINNIFVDKEYISKV